MILDRAKKVTFDFLGNKKIVPIDKMTSTKA